MAVDTQLEAVIRDIDRFLSGSPSQGGEPDLRSFLITEIYLERLLPAQAGLRRRGALRHLMADLASRLARGPLAREVTVERSFSRVPDGPRHLFVFTLPWTRSDGRPTLRPRAASRGRSVRAGTKSSCPGPASCWHRTRPSPWTQPWPARRSSSWKEARSSGRSRCSSRTFRSLWWHRRMSARPWHVAWRIRP